MHKRQCGERGAKAARLAATGHSRTLCTYDSSEVFASMRSFRIASSSANLADDLRSTQLQMVSARAKLLPGQAVWFAKQNPKRRREHEPNNQY